MWLAPGVTLEIPHRVQISVAIAVAGIALLAAAVFQFWKSKTTVNPMTPEKSSALVTHGVYRWSRNPIYLADAALLLAWAVYLAKPVALLGIPVFVLYINRFQIRPEEEALKKRFPAYGAYCRRVRRWL